MECAECGAEATEEQNYCNGCGASLEGVTESTAAATPQATDASTADEQGETESSEPTVPPPPPPPAPGAPLPPPRADEATSEPTPGPEGHALDDGPLITPTDDSDQVDLEGLALDPDETSRVERIDEPAVTTAPAADPSATPTEQLVIVPAPESYGGATDELPALFDGGDDLSEYQASREPFKLRVVLIFALFTVAALVMVSVADVVKLFTTIPVDGILQGTFMLDDFGSNLAVASYVGAGVMVLGGLLACFGLRWGAGLAGGAGIALAGWAALVIGVIEVPIESARAITRNPTTPDPFTLTVTRDLGYWMVIAVGGLGIVVFLASLTQIGRGRRASLNPWVAALGAIAPLVLAAGPLIPVNGATFADNFSADGLIPPIDYIVGRLIQVGLIAAFGAFGFLLVRGYGLGLAAGSVSVALWLWVSSLAELGDFPIGIADRNFFAEDTIPHGVTSVGAGLTVALLIVAAAVAVTAPQSRRRR